MWENVKNWRNHLVGRDFVLLWKRRPTRWFRKILTFSHMNSVFFQHNWLYLGRKTQLVWKKTQFMWENVKKMQNHLVGRRFHNITKPWETFHCAKVSINILIIGLGPLSKLQKAARGSSFLDIMRRKKCLSLLHSSSSCWLLEAVHSGHKISNVKKIFFPIWGLNFEFFWYLTWLD